MRRPIVYRVGSSPEQPDPVARALRRASNARASADRIAAVYQRLEHQSRLVPPGLASILLDTAARHRESERRFRAVAVLHQQHAHRLARLSAARNATTAPADAGGPSPFMAALSEQLDRLSTGLSLLGKRGMPLSSAASDATSRAAMNVELSVGEGPAHDVAVGWPGIGSSPLVSSDPARRWPLYGPALAPLGVGTVIAARLGPDESCIGALLAFTRSSEPDSGLVDRVQDLAMSLSHALGAGPDSLGGDPPDSLAVLMEEAYLHPGVHQAAGMLSVQLEVTLGDAYAILRARAFSDNSTLDALAAQVVAGQVNLSTGTS